MRLQFVEVVQMIGDDESPVLSNWGKFAVGEFEEEEWARRSALPAAAGQRLLLGRGWAGQHRLVLDLQTGEGAVFRLGGLARVDLAKHRIWVCPLFEPFLEWLYTHPDPRDLPPLVVLPDAPFEVYGHRRPGPVSTPNEENL